MKIKKVSKKLVLNKSTMSNLNTDVMTGVRGGLSLNCTDETDCCVPSEQTCATETCPPETNQCPTAACTTTCPTSPRYCTNKYCTINDC